MSRILGHQRQTSLSRARKPLLPKPSPAPLQLRRDKAQYPMTRPLQSSRKRVRPRRAGQAARRKPSRLRSRLYPPAVGKAPSRGFSRRSSFAKNCMQAMRSRTDSGGSPYGRGLLCKCSSPKRDTAFAECACLIRHARQTCFASFRWEITAPPSQGGSQTIPQLCFYHLQV